MGRGLSELQRQILTVVYERRQGRDFAEEERRQKEMRSDPMHRRMLLLLHGPDADPDEPYSISDYPDATHPQIIAAVYDWPVWMWQRGCWLRPSEGGEVRHHTHNFRSSRVGAEEYNRRTASYYRAVGRLKRRGLLKDQRHGLLITAAGIEAVEALSVSSRGDPDLH